MEFRGRKSQAEKPPDWEKRTKYEIDAGSRLGQRLSRFGGEISKYRRAFPTTLHSGTMKTDENTSVLWYA